MTNNIPEDDNSKKAQASPVFKPDENAGFYFSSGIKIFDPNTKEVLLHKRGD